jgi:hypothetical protein
MKDRLAQALMDEPPDRHQQGDQRRNDVQRLPEPLISQTGIRSYPCAPPLLGVGGTLSRTTLVKVSARRSKQRNSMRGGHQSS